MSLRKEHLVELPSLPFRQIVDELVDALGLRKVVMLRLVSARFDQEILDVILARQIIAERKKIRFPNIRRRLMNKLLLKRVENPSIEETPLISTIRRTATLINRTYQKREALTRDAVEYTLCTAAVNLLGSRRTATFMTPGSNEQAHAIDDLNVLLTATVLVGSPESLEILLSEGADVNTISRCFGTHLQAAAARGSHEMVLSLLEKGADINVVCGDDVLYLRENNRKEGTALRSASRRDYKQVVRLLLDPVYKLNSSGVDYENAVMDAVRADHVDMVGLLLKSGTVTNLLRLQYKILWTACRLGFARLVQNMLDEGIDVNATDIGGPRALEYAASSGHAPIVSLLFEQGADLKYEGSERHAIQAAACHGYQEVVQILLDHGADVNTSGLRYLTPLWEAATSQQISMMRFLFSKGADLAAEECGDYAFFRAVLQGHEEVVRSLAEMGVSVDGVPGDPEPPPILNATIHGQKRMVEVLLELGAQWVDPMKSAWREKFMDGTYPKALPPTRIAYLKD